MTKMRELKTEIEMPRLTMDERPRLLPLICVDGHWKIDAFGRWWSPRWLIAVGALAAAAALWAWLGR